MQARPVIGGATYVVDIIDVMTFDDAGQDHHDAGLLGPGRDAPRRRRVTAVPPRLSFVTLGVREMPTMRGFYKGLGWTEQPGASDQFCAFLLGGVLLALYGIDDLAHEAAPGEPLTKHGWGGHTFALNVDERDQVDEVVAGHDRGRRPQGRARSSTGRGAAARATSPTPRATAGRSPGPRASPSTSEAPSRPSADDRRGARACRWRRSPCGPKMARSSTGPSTAPNQCGVQVVNSTASPGLDGEVVVAEQQAQPPVEDVQPVVALVDRQLRGRSPPLGADVDLVGTGARWPGRGC